MCHLTPTIYPKSTVPSSYQFATTASCNTVPKVPLTSCSIRSVPSNSTIVTPAPKKPTTIECIICLDKFKYDASLHTPNCAHSSCRNCLRDYFKNLQRGPSRARYDTVPCPQTGCENQFITADTLNIIFKKKEIKDWWEFVNTTVFLKNKVTCPFKSCGVSYDVDEDLLKECTFTTCLVCHKGFCTACQTQWHPGVMKVVNEKEHIRKTLEVAKNNAWTRCPKCRRFIEKVDGCTSMICTCGASFCYRCGGLQINHTCNNRCENFSQERLEEIRRQMFNADNAK